MSNKPRLPQSKHHPAIKAATKARARIVSGGSTDIEDVESDSGTPKDATLSQQDTKMSSGPAGPSTTGGGTGDANTSGFVSEGQHKYKTNRKTAKREYERAWEHFINLEALGFNILAEGETIESMTGRKKEVINLMEKYKLTGEGHDRVWRFDVDDFARRRGGPEVNWEGHTITEQDLLDHNLLKLLYGTTYGYKVVNGCKELVFAVRFTPFSTMSEDELAKVRFCGHQFNRTFQLFNPVKNNGAHIKGGSVGVMAAEGWRAGYETGKDYGTYRKKRVSKEEQRFLDLQYRVHTGQMGRIAGYFDDSFESLCPAAHAHAINWMDENKMPAYGSFTTHKNGATSSGSNLTVTRGDFANAIHHDGDASPFTFGIWFLANAKGNPVLDEKTTCNAVQGGQFVLPEFKIAVDFGGCAGKVDMMWRGKQDLHATAGSRTRPGYQRFGTSIQGAKRLWQRVQNALGKPAEDVHIVAD